MTATHRLLLTIAIATALVLGCAETAATPPRVSPATRCEEDQPCWDCTRMGNRICGPDTDQEDTK